jgi:hypothetical protein
LREPVAGGWQAANLTCVQTWYGTALAFSVGAFQGIEDV